MEERVQLRDALAAVQVLRDIGMRQQLVEELSLELGKDFDPPRTGALSTDCAAIVRACARLGALRELVLAVNLVGGSSPEVARLAELVETLAPEAVLTSEERLRAADLLARIPPPSIKKSFIDSDLMEYWDESILDIGDALERLGTVVGRDAYAVDSLLALLERAAHQADNFSRNQCHQIIRNAAARYGRDEDISRLCEQLSADDAVTDQSPASTAAVTSVDRVIPVLLASTSGEDDVRAIEAAPSAQDHPRLVTRPIIGGIPPQNPSFTGRREILKDLRRALRVRSQVGPPLYTLQGFAGVGKTQLAIEYAYRYLSEYDLIWWIPSEYDTSITRSLQSLARRLSLPESDDSESTVRTVLDELATGWPSPKWLLIYDGAGEPVDVRPYLPSGPGQVLITSRNRDWSNESTLFEVDMFSEEESIDFLTRQWEDLSDEEAHTLATELGHLPLALDQAIAVHRVTGMPLDEYLRLLRKSPGLVLELDEGESSEYPQSVAKTCRLAFDRLRDRSVGASQLLQACSFFGPSEIAVPLLGRARGASLPPELSKTVLDNIKLRGAIRDIGRYGLARLDASRDFIKIHTLVGKLLQDTLPKDQRDVMQRAAHSLLAFATPQEPDDERNWPMFRQVAPHMVPSGIVLSRDTQARQAVLDLIRFLFVTGEYRQSADLAEIAVETWTKSPGASKTMPQRANFHLGNALRALGEYQRARAINDKTLDIMRRELGEDDEYTLRLANSHGADLRLMGEFREALKLDKNTLDHYRKVLGEEDGATLRSAHNLAVDHRLLGDFSEALKLDKETLRQRRAILRENSPEVLSSITSLARDLYGMGDYEKALEEEERSIGAFIALELEHNVFFLHAQRNLAIFLRKVGRYSESLKLSAATLEQSINRFGPKHEYSLSAMMTLANALHVSGELEKARETNENAWQLYRENFGNDHPFTLACANNVSITWRALDRVAEAKALDLATIEALLRVLGDNHLYTLCGMTNLSNDYSMSGNHAEAKNVSQDVFNKSKQIRPKDHPYTLACATNLVLDLEAIGATDEAASLRTDTRRRLQRKLGRNHPDTVNMERGFRAECDTEVPPT